MSVLSFPISQAAHISEAITVLQNLVDASYGRDLPGFDKARETRARLDALLLIERYLIFGGAA